MSVFAVTVGLKPPSTVTVQVSVCPPSTVVTVIVAVPADTAVTLPSTPTVATFRLLEVQVTRLSDAFSGEMVVLEFVFVSSESKLKSIVWVKSYSSYGCVFEIWHIRLR